MPPHHWLSPEQPERRGPEVPEGIDPAQREAVRRSYQPMSPEPKPPVYANPRTGQEFQFGAKRGCRSRLAGSRWRVPRRTLVRHVAGRRRRAKRRSRPPGSRRSARSSAAIGWPVRRATRSTRPSTATARPRRVGVGDPPPWIASPWRSRCAVGCSSVKPPRHGVGDPRPSGAAHRWPQFVLTVGAEPLAQREVELVATADVVVHEPAGDAGGACDVLDRDLVVAAGDGRRRPARTAEEVTGRSSRAVRDRSRRRSPAACTPGPANIASTVLRRRPGH